MIDAFVHWPEDVLMLVVGGSMITSIVALLFGIMSGRRKFF